MKIMSKEAPSIMNLRQKVLRLPLREVMKPKPEPMEEALTPKHRSYSDFLELTGVWVNPSRHPLVIVLQRSRTYFCIVSTILQLVSIFGTGYNKKTLQENTFYGLVGTLISVQLLHLQLSRDKLSRLITTLEEFRAQHTQPWQQEIMLRESKAGWMVVDIYWWVQIFYCIFYLFVPFLLDFFIGIFWPEFPDVRVPVPLQGFVNLTPRRSLWAVLLSTAGSAWATVSIIGHIGVECAVVMAVVYVRAEMMVLRGRLARLRQGPPSLAPLAAHHQRLLRVLEEMNEVFGFPTAVQNALWSVALCVAIYAVIIIEDAEDLRPALQNLYNLMCCMGIVCCLCIQGETLETQNSKLLDSLYDLPWYEESLAFRRELIIMMQQANMPYVINFHLKSRVNVNTFVQIANGAYSYSMMLKSTT